jgi:hypothetical protein
LGFKFKRTRNGEPRGRETVENGEVVEVETGMNEAMQDQTQPEQRGGGEKEWYSGGHNTGQRTGKQ